MGKEKERDEDPHEEESSEISPEKSSEQSGDQDDGEGVVIKAKPKSKGVSKSARMVEYDDGRLWFQKRSGTILIGLTQQGLDEIGAVESLELPSEGDDFDKEDIVVELEGDQGSVSVTTPAAGFIIETNTALDEDTALINEDPMGEGWLVRLEIQDDTDLDEYLS